MSIVYAAARGVLPANAMDRHAAYKMAWSPSVGGVDRAH
jgi:hypothetical protein